MQITVRNTVLTRKTLQCIMHLNPDIRLKSLPKVQLDGFQHFYKATFSNDGYTNLTLMYKKDNYVLYAVLEVRNRIAHFNRD